ncbi:DUF6024 family protein [Erwiniaceae bacterium BAC15a-03b]|uniref:DUF6024 family protein n=1 Tax=Winslowiella arboricola TaxID=2978220 RepID=A0A9J6PJS0_9GAMM|nr:DUF6024 family protein [Winslowiella arboricola]MCU5771969.1 DUF6024 family protein [Winslowiella arboricola]MCU5775968.1 DUF6024 family protein [Winslowiella arboricola]
MEPSQQQVNALRNELRQTLSRHYKLENHDIFFMKSLRIARVILSHQFYKQEVARCHARQALQQPVSELLQRPAMQIGEPGHVTLISHVDPCSGEVTDLRGCAGKGVVDGSHSFATLHHEELVRDSAIFVAPLNLHAGLSPALTIIALRTAEFSTLLRSELRLFEAATSVATPLEKSLAIINNGYWQPFRMAPVAVTHGAVTLCR